jgi:hypothetical protein
MLFMIDKVLFYLLKASINVIDYFHILVEETTAVRYIHLALSQTVPK